MTAQQKAQVDFIKGIVFGTPSADAGNDRVFISDVYDYMVKMGQDEGITLEQFKAIVLSVRLGLRLTRCDLVGAYDMSKVDRSSCTYMGAEFHFICR